MALYALLRSNPSASAEEIEHGLDGNLCRCTGDLFFFLLGTDSPSLGSKSMKLGGGGG